MVPILDHYELILRLCIAATLGSIIGFERERLKNFAGLRTHMLVCLGATLIMIVSQYGFSEVLLRELVILDPSRVASQVVSGIGFLGAGTILFWKNTIRGLTTAASLWAVAAVGLAVGSGLYIASIVATLLILIILAGLRPIEQRYLKKQPFAGSIKFLIKPGEVTFASIKELFKEANIRFEPTKFQVDKKSTKEEEFQLWFASTTQNHLLKIADEIKNLAGVKKMELIEEGVDSE